MTAKYSKKGLFVPVMVQYQLDRITVQGATSDVVEISFQANFVFINFRFPENILVQYDLQHFGVCLEKCAVGLHFNLPLHKLPGHTPANALKSNEANQADGCKAMSMSDGLVQCVAKMRSFYVLYLYCCEHFFDFFRKRTRYAIAANFKGGCQQAIFRCPCLM